MADPVTKVLYDVSQAIKELDKLNDKVNESEKKAKSAFSTRSVNAYDKRLKKLAYTLGGTDFSAKGLITTIGGSAAVFGAAAASVASVVANMVDLKGVLRDTTAELDGFIEAFDRVREARELVSTFGDVAAQRDLEFAQRAVKLDQAEQATKQNEIEVRRDIERQKLEIIKDRVRQQEQIVRDGLKKEEDLVKRLADRTKRDAAADFQGPVGKRALDLGAAARQAAFEGNVDLAEELEDAARRAGEEAGNHSLFLKDQATTREAINRALKSQIKDQQSANQEEVDKLSSLRDVEDAHERNLELLNQELKTILRQNRELTAQAKLIKDARLAQRRQEEADTAARGVQAKAGAGLSFINVGFESGLERIENTFQKVAQLFTGGARDQFAVDALQSAIIEGNQPVFELLKRVQAGEAVSAPDFAEALKAFRTTDERVAVLEKLDASGRVGAGQRETTDRLIKTQEQLRQAFEEFTGFRRGRGDDTAIREGSEGPTRSDFNAARDAVLENTKALQEQSSPGRAQAAATDQAALRSQGAAQQLAAAPSVVNVNANVKGGIIDEEVTRTITDLIRRELRKQTTQTTQNVA